ncbi:acyl-CoA synthase [Phenylobacterium sp. Root77]|jgi:long-chain acyl-CoA synthetase|uniref:AMP-binding protein n=1 Tax=unclassified Phenylobacterium TaxID=2640670 RepID=UPI0006F77916|nr:MULTISPECIES: AMP-binding protein [unclassified Phenylobacterium]KQW70869.1 acyl-CoA synthase [Phenylobacterium sp. Root1277]KQW90710.1 acyl-CoA synthase [Phenylobacterium sp. Root1290]KRC39658.1 acyl-CoA synthase [Phenylobacterium sp. Root77]
MEDLKERTNLEDVLNAAAATGMTTAVWAKLQPDKPAVINPDGTARTFAQVNAAANKLTRLFRQHGLKAGDSLAIVCSNRAEFIEVQAATLRSGLRITPVNWHLTTDEIAYIINDCEAKVLVGEARVASVAPAAEQCPNVVLKLAVGGDIPGFQSYDDAIAPLDGSDIDDPVLGNQMMYTSGTTGRPKGVFREAPTITPQAMYGLRGYDDDSIQLCAGPAYHAAPLAFDVRAAMGAGAPLYFIDKWDSELVLRTISEKKVTHLHLVPIMFQRLLALPEEVRARYPIDHVKYIVHGAAPCPPEVKQAMIEWFGPVLSEYYAGSEGGAGFTISSEEWLKKPGSVGKRPALLQVRILDEEGNECPPGVPGGIYHQLPPGGGFTYFKDQAKTNANRVGDFFTMGDVGYFDEDDYLFLTGRNAETIISGGVNIYPQEVDNELIKHDAVADSATVGVPHDEWGEQVKAVILLNPGFEPSEELAQEILDFGRKALPAFKVPRSLDFVTQLPRSEAGKIQRNKVRAPYWEGRTRQI